MHHSQLVETKVLLRKLTGVIHLLRTYPENDIIMHDRRALLEDLNQQVKATLPKPPWTFSRRKKTVFSTLESKFLSLMER